MRYLTPEQILLIHSMVVDETGGSHGVRDMNAILSVTASVEQSVFGNDLYPTIFSKAAVYARNILMNHAFIDGNKRTGTATAVVFLENNGYQLTLPTGRLEPFALEIVEKRLDIPTIAQWFEENSKKLEE